MQNFSFKRLTAWLLTLMMVFSVIPVNVSAAVMDDFLSDVTSYFLSQGDVMGAVGANISAATAEEDGTDTYALTKAATTSTIITMSDYQNSSLTSDAKKTVPQTIVNAMVSAGVTPELALIGGDYTDGSVGADGDDQSQASLKTELGNLTGILTSAWSDLPYYAIQGNHDYSGFLTDGTLTATGAYPQDNYIVYLINEDSFPWWQGNYGSGSTTTEDKATVTATTKALSTYLDSLISAGETRPVIIMSHVPMHWSERSTAANWYYDNIYANVLFDAINEKAEELDILFLFGHNHSHTASGGDYDYEIGGALSYVAKGESMKVPDGTDGTSNYTTKKLNFTYMNSGYVGKYAGDTSYTSISAITIDSDSIDIARYTYSGSVVNETIALTGGSGATEDSGDDTTTDSSDTTVATGEWVTIPGTPATTSTGKFYHVTEELVTGEIYLLVSNDSYLKGIQDTGETYSKTTSGDAITYDTTIALQTMTTSSDSEGDYTETTDESLMWKAVESSIDGYFYLQNVKTGAYLRAGYSLDSTYGRNINTTSSTSDTYTSFKAVSGSDYGIYAVESSSATSSYRFVRYSNSNAWYQGRTTYQSGAAQLWKAETTGSGEATPDIYARLTGEFVQTYDASQATTASYVLGNLKIETSTDGSAVVEQISVTSDMVTWDKSFNGSAIGTYTGTVTYEGQTLGTVTVNVTGTATEVEGNGEWVALPSGYVYTLDTDGMDPGSDNKYIIVGSDNDYALTLSGSTIGYAEVTVSGDTVTLEVDDPSIYEFYFKDNSSNESGSYLLTQNGSSTVYHSGGNLYYGSDNKGYWHVVTGSDGEYRVYDTDGSNWHLNYGYVWGSNTTNSFSVSSNQRYVRLYKYTGGSTGSNNGYARLTGTIEQVYSNADATTEATVLGKVSIQTSTDQSTVASTVAVTSDMVTWDTEFNGSVAGTYTGTVTYEGQNLGTIKVTVMPVSVAKIELITAEGSVTRGSRASAVTGGKIRVTYSDGSTAERDVVLGMLNNDGKTEGTYSGLTVTYGGKTVGGFTLTVNPREGNNYPEYPKEGSVKVNKTADATLLQSTGLVNVELSTSGLPMNQGVDVVVVLDTSSSMQETVDGFSSNRLTILRPALNSLIGQLQAEREDGSDPDLDISIVCFNGFTGNGNDDTDYGSENYIEVQAYSTPNSGGLLTDKSGDGWVDIMDLSTNWADEDQGNITTGSGTNYDEGLLLAYEQLAAKQESWADDESRTQFVVFMSDGAPFQYNGVYSNYTSTEWNNWLLGNYETTADIPDTVTNKEYYTGYAAGKGQDHRIAEAIKGDPDKYYDIVTTTADTNGKTQMESVPGLGATLYSIGYLLADNGDVTKATQGVVLENIASGSEVYFDVTTADELDSAFSTIVGDVLFAATEAYFVDTMGHSFDLQMGTTVDKRIEGGGIQVTTLAGVTPKIEVLNYNIYKASDVGNTVNGVAVTADMVGQRYGDPTVVETITFAETFTEVTSGGKYYSTDGGTTKWLIEDTSDLTGATLYIKEYAVYSDQIGGGTTNILGANGIITAKSFWYNTSASTVKIDTDSDGTADYDLLSETFYWNIGTINNVEWALSYWVYLTGSMEGNATAGSYATNESAVLYYVNWLGNNAQQGTTSPQTGWKSANVSYAFYLVNDQGQPVVNQTTGQTGSFYEAVKVTQPVVFQEILLNNLDTVDTIEASSNTILPEGYELYDTSASYKVVILSEDGKGSWTITSSKAVQSSYVTGYSGTLATDEPKVTSDKSAEGMSDYTLAEGYDYSHTTVWFALLWIPTAIPDQVVVDYGIPVDISVLGNDQFGENGTLNGIGLVDNIPIENGATKIYADSHSNNFGTDDLTLTYGTVKMIAPKVRYTPANMQMSGYDQFAYEVEYKYYASYNNGVPVGNPQMQYYYGTVTVIPATTIYYEETFLTYENASLVDVGSDGNVITKDADGNDITYSKVESGNGAWSDVGTAADKVQSEDRPGQYSLPAIDANNVYGYDGIYNSYTTYSLGKARMVTVHQTKPAEDGSYQTTGYNGYAPKASFTFTGTGFDIISLTDSDAGMILVTVKKDGAVVKNTIVANYYGMDYQQLKDEDGNLMVDEDGNAVMGWVSVDKADGQDTIWQVPVIKMDSEALGGYGTYTVEIQLVYMPIFDLDEGGAGNNEYNFVLDAIRIYDPAGVGDSIDDTIENAYKADNEYNPQYFLIRDMLVNELNDDTLTNDAVNAVVFIDGLDEATLAEYKNPGPNNEVYLAHGQSIAFNVAVTYGVEQQMQLNSTTGELEPNGLYKGSKPVVNLGAKIAYGGAITVGLNADKSKDITTTTDMYHTLPLDWAWVINSNTDDDGNTTYTVTYTASVVLANTTEGSVLSLTNIKITENTDEYIQNLESEGSGASPASTYGSLRSVDNTSMAAYASASAAAADTADEEVEESIEFYVDQELVDYAASVMSLRFAPAPEPVPVFIPEVLEYTVSSGFFGYKTVTVITSKDVASLTVNGTEATNLSGSRLFGTVRKLIADFEDMLGIEFSADEYILWTVTTKSADSYEIVAYNADGLSSDASVTDSNSSITMEDITDFIDRSEIIGIMEDLAERVFNPERMESRVYERFGGRELVITTSEDVDYIVADGEIIDRYITETVIDLSKDGEETVNRIWITEAEEESIEVTAYDEEGVASSSDTAE